MAGLLAALPCRIDDKYAESVIMRSLAKITGQFKAKKVIGKLCRIDSWQAVEACFNVRARRWRQRAVMCAWSGSYLPASGAASCAVLPAPPTTSAATHVLTECRWQHQRTVLHSQAHQPSYALCYEHAPPPSCYP